MWTKAPSLQLQSSQHLVCPTATFRNHPVIRWMDKILHDPKDPKLWEIWYIPYNG